MPNARLQTGLGAGGGPREKVLTGLSGAGAVLGHGGWREGFPSEQIKTDPGARRQTDTTENIAFPQIRAVKHFSVTSRYVDVGRVRLCCRRLRWSYSHRYRGAVQPAQ